MEEGSQRNIVVLYVLSIIFSVRVSMCVYYNIKMRVLQYNIWNIGQILGYRESIWYILYSMILWGSNGER